MARSRSLAKWASTATLLSLTVSSAGQAQAFDWKVEKNRIMMARALNGWADFCSSTFYFTRSLRRSPEELEAKINAHLLLSNLPDLDVARWADWIPYADPNSDVAKPSEDRAADALLAARADSSSAAQAEKLYTNTMRDYLSTVFSKCRMGASDPFIAQNFYAGPGDLDRALAAVESDFDQAVKELDKP